MEYNWRIAVEHEIIRDTVGYDLISQIEDTLDVPIVIDFLEIVQNYKKICELLNEK